MKCYVSTRVSRMDEARSLMAQLRQDGHEITLDWTDLPVKKPFAQFPQETRELSGQGISAVLAADVFILLAHHDGNGVFCELGAALASHEINQKPIIYAVASAIPEATFHYHPAIIWKKSTAEVLEELCATKS